MNGLLVNNKQLNVYLIGLAGATGIISIFNAIRQHYLRLKKQARKQIKSGTQSDTNSENISRTEIKPECEEISDQVIEKIVEKIMNSIIHTTCICIDKIKDNKSSKESKENIEHKEENEDDLLKSSVINETKSQILSKDDKEDEIQIVEEQSEKKKIIEMNSLENNADKDLVELIATIESKQDFLPDFERNLFAYNQVRQGESVMSCKYYKYWHTSLTYSLSNY